MSGNEAFSRVLIDSQLTDVGWNVSNGISVRYEVSVGSGKRADYVLCDRHGHSLAVIEAKRFSINPSDAAEQARHYAEQLQVPYIFLANGNDILFWDYQSEAFPRKVKTFFTQEDLERRIATQKLRSDPMDVGIDSKIAGRDYQQQCIDAVCREISLGRRRMLVEMATGTGKTRTAAALIKRLFEANAVTRVLFLVDRIQLALQTEDAFAEHLPDYPSYTLRAGRRFLDEKRITITTLQSMVNIYHEYSSGYFDLVISDECHRSIYGKWSGVLKHFDGVQIGLTATPCVMKEIDEAGGDDEDKAFVRDTLKFFEVDKPTFSYKIKQAIADGYLVPYQIFKAKTVKTASEGGFPVAKSDLDWSAMDDAIKTEFQTLFGDKDSITVDPSALERKFTIPARNRAIVKEFREVMEHGYIDQRGVQRKPLIGKTIVFAVTKRHADTLARMFDEAFADKKPDPSIRYADYVVSGMGQDDTVDGLAKIKRFKKEPFPNILVSVNMLDTGFDCPDVVNLVFARFTKSAILYQQMRGRGTRKAQGKPIFTLFDFVGVTDYHADDDEYAEGGFVIEQKARPKYQAKRLLALDIEDHIDPASRAWVDVDENGNLIFTEPSQQQANQICVRFESWLLQQQHLEFEQERWLRLIGEQLKANPEGFDEFSVGHFAFPPFSLIGGLNKAVQVFGGADPLSAILHSLNRTVLQFGAGDATEADLRPDV